jgi:hypothetical protein
VYNRHVMPQKVKFEPATKIEVTGVIGFIVIRDKP